MREASDAMAFIKPYIILLRLAYLTILHLSLSLINSYIPSTNQLIFQDAPDDDHKKLRG
jgi:hypothetical protein